MKSFNLNIFLLYFLSIVFMIIFYGFKTFCQDGPHDKGLLALMGGGLSPDHIKMY